jgi:hypothetical protein
MKSIFFLLIPMILLSCGQHEQTENVSDKGSDSFRVDFSGKPKRTTGLMNYGKRTIPVLSYTVTDSLFSVQWVSVFEYPSMADDKINFCKELQQYLETQNQVSMEYHNAVCNPMIQAGYYHAQGNDVSGSGYIIVGNSKAYVIGVKSVRISSLSEEDLKFLRSFEIVSR